MAIPFSIISSCMPSSQMMVYLIQSVFGSISLFLQQVASAL